MRESSALLERLDKRFQNIDDRADRRSVGMRGRDSFLGHFDERMKRLEGLVQIPEMAAFRRLPKRRSAFDPWGSMGNWSALGDLTYLKWMAEQEEEIEVEDTPRVSAWGTANGYTGGSERARKSAWLNTPYTPARVAGKPVPKPRQATRNAAPISSVSKTRDQKRRTRRQQAAVAPALSPLKRALGRATVAQEHRRVERQVVNSLPPALAKTTGSRFVAQQMGEQAAVKRTNRFKTPSPMMRMVRDEVEAALPDQSVRSTAVAKGRTPSLASSSSSALIARDTSGLSNRPNRKARGLRPQGRQLNLVQEMAQVASSSSLSQVKKSSNKISPTLQSIVEVSVQESVPTAVSKKVSRVLRSSASVSAVVSQLLPDVTEQVVQQVTRVMQAASMTALSDFSEPQTSGQSPERRAARQIKQVVEQVIEVVIGQSDALIQQVAQTGSSTGRGLQTPTVQQSQTIVRQLQRKGVSRSLAEKAVATLPAVSIASSSVQQLVDVVYQDLVQGARQPAVQKSVVALLTQQGVREEKARRVVTQVMRDASYVLDVQTLLDESQRVLQQTGVSTSTVNEGQIERIVRAVVSQQNATGIVGQLFARSDSGVASKAMSRGGGTLTSGAQRSLLPKVAGEDFTDRIVADLVNEIAQFSSRELMLESSVGQQQLMNTFEKAIKRIGTQQRSMRVSDLDWVDVQAVSSMSDIDSIDAEDSTKSNVSPWFTREVESTGQDAKLQPMQQAASRMLSMLAANPTRPEVVAKHTGLSVREVTRVLAQVQESSRSPDVSTVTDRSSIASRKQDAMSSSVLQRGQSSVEEQIVAREQQASGVHPLEHLWERATAPVELPQWRGTGSSSFKPFWGESAKAWRLDPKRQPVHPFSVRTPVDETLLQPEGSRVEASDDSVANTMENKPSPWFTRAEEPSPSKEKYVTGLGFVPETISGDARLSSSEIAQFGSAQAVQLTAADVRGRKAQWLQPNRTVVLDNGTVIHAKVAQRLGIKPSRQSSASNLPLSWTLEGVQLQSDHKSLPSWAKRASGKPQVSASPEFLMALAKTSNAEDVAQVILDNMGAGAEAILPKTAMTVIDQIRKEAHRGLDTLQQQVEAQEQAVVRSRGPKDRSRRRVSRTARAVMDGFTGLKPISTAGPSETGAPQGIDKVSKLAKQLESLVSLAENDRRDEAREGVRMAEDSHDAVAEGQAAGAGEERDYTIDIEALRQEVMSAFEQEMSLRSLRSFDNNDNTDPWW